MKTLLVPNDITVSQVMEFAEKNNCSVRQVDFNTLKLVEKPKVVVSNVRRMNRQGTTPRDLEPVA